MKENVIKIFYEEDKYLLYKKYESDSGYDIRAKLDNTIYLNPGEYASIETGVSMLLPKGWEVVIRPRSGLAKENGITVLNSPGTIDESYKGEIKVIIINLGKETVSIKDGNRIAQLIFQKKDIPVIKEFIKSKSEENKKNFDEASRGQQGFGSTGVD